jgi:hypothetical protein
MSPHHAPAMHARRFSSLCWPASGSRSVGGLSLRVAARIDSMSVSRSWDVPVELEMVCWFKNVGSGTDVTKSSACVDRMINSSWTNVWFTSVGCLVQVERLCWFK